VSKPCQIRVTSDGKYCCDVNHLTVRDGCIGAISYANLPLTLIELEVTEGTWIPASVESIEGSGQDMLLAPGEYRFVIDCSAYDGQTAPEEGAVALCYECCKVDDYGSILSAQLAELCLKLETNNDAAEISVLLELIQACLDQIKLLVAANNNITILTEIETQLLAVCDKLLENGETQGNILVELQALCEKILETNTFQAEVLVKVCALADLIKEVPDACAESAIIGWCGRPAQFADYAYGDISAPSLPEFNTLWEAAGGKTWIAGFDGTGGGECHMFCPAIPGATFTINGVAPGNGNVLFEPNPNAEALGCVSTPALTTCDPFLAQLVQQLIDQNTTLIEKMCLILGDPEVPCPECENTKEPVTYTNADNTTELDVSVGSNGDIKITSGNGDSSDAAVVACIESCLAAGDDVVVTWTTVNGGSGSATLLAGALTNAFPGFYNQSTDASGDSGKLLTLTCGY
jgi:hypothetical protein